MSNAIIACIIVCLALLATGCGNEALRMNAELGRGMLEAQSTSGPIIRQLRIDASVAAGRAAHDRGAPESTAQAAAQAEAQRWQCALDGHGIYASAVSAYIGTLALWNAGQDFGLTDVLPYARRALDGYRFLASCLASLGSAILPEVPAFFDLIPSGWSLSDAGN